MLFERKDLLYSFIVFMENNLAEPSKNSDTDLEITRLDHQNNVRNSSMMSNAVKRFDILITNLSVLRYFDSLTKLFSDF